MSTFDGDLQRRSTDHERTDPDSSDGSATDRSETMLGNLAERIGPAALAHKIQRRRDARAAAARPASPEAEQASVHQAAERGTAGTGESLPHREAIQASFGKHDISQVQAHTGAAAGAAAESMGAEAFATGDHVAFAGSPSLHTAAHEAAHVVQQRGGVQFKGGVSEEGDTFEQHADAVADRVVQGQSAEGLLDQHAGAGAAAAAPVQRKLTIGKKGAEQVWWDRDGLMREMDKTGLLDPLRSDDKLWPVAYDILGDWVGALGPIAVGGAKVTSGIDRKYDSLEELATALIGEARSQQHLDEETALAAKLQSDPRVLKNLQTLMPKIHAYVEQQEGKVKLWRDMQSAYRGLWTFMGGPWRFKGIKGYGALGWTVKDCMTQPYDNIKANFNCIKMASNVMNQRDKPKMFVPDKRSNYSGAEREIEPDSKRHTTMSLVESEFWTMEARAYDIPLTAGVSGSMNRMYFLAQQVGATADELVALAWAGHVVFNQHYTQFGNDPHRLHEIMDPLNHYVKIDYNASRYAELLTETMSEGIQWPTKGIDTGPVAIEHGEDATGEKDE